MVRHQTTDKRGKPLLLQVWKNKGREQNYWSPNRDREGWHFPGGSVVKSPPANAGDTGDVGSIPVSGRSPGGGNGNLLQYSCLENSIDRGAWRATVHGVTKSQTLLSAHECTQFAYCFYCEGVLDSVRCFYPYTMIIMWFSSIIMI